MCNSGLARGSKSLYFPADLRVFFATKRHSLMRFHRFTMPPHPSYKSYTILWSATKCCAHSHCLGEQGSRWQGFAYLDTKVARAARNAVLSANGNKGRASFASASAGQPVMLTCVEVDLASRAASA
jgi:hypothetical protein